MNAKRISRRAERKTRTKPGPSNGSIDHDEDFPAVLEFERDGMGIASKE